MPWMMDMRANRYREEGTTIKVLITDEYGRKAVVEIDKLQVLRHIDIPDGMKVKIEVFNMPDKTECRVGE